MPKQIKMKITLNSDGKSYSAKYYMKNHLILNAQIKFLINSYSAFQLIDSKNTMKDFYWYREYPKTESTKKEDLYKLFLSNKKPFIEKLSDKTIYLRIPSFQYSQKILIDSLLINNKTLIDSTPNLIIDIRNGTGGSDYAWNNIIPIVYTNPMFLSGIEFRATELNAQGYEKYTIGKTDSSFINKCNDIAKSMRAHQGEFFNYYSKKDYGIKTMDTVFAYPKHVAIIVNHRNGSADEQFLYLARQSKKVKIFGTPTMGCYDISNLNIITSPDGNFKLWYAMSRSCRLPDYPLDDIGIQPDIYFSRDISDIDWVEYVKMILE
jgi:C-terminal processing protease CtpA/Prc